MRDWARVSVVTGRCWEYRVNKVFGGRASFFFLFTGNKAARQSHFFSCGEKKGVDSLSLFAFKALNSSSPSACAFRRPASARRAEAKKRRKKIAMRWSGNGEGARSPARSNNNGGVVDDDDDADDDTAATSSSSRHQADRASGARPLAPGAAASPSSGEPSNGGRRRSSGMGALDATR